MTTRNTPSSSTIPSSAIPASYSVHPATGILRDWVIALNPNATGEWYSYRLFDIFSPFGIALQHTWALRDAFTQTKGQWKFMGHTLPTEPNVPQGPASTPLTAFEVLEAIDTYDLKALKSHQRRLQLNLFVFAAFLSLLLYFLPHMLASLFNSSFSNFPFSLCVIWGIGLTSIGYLCHRKTTLGRKAITLPKGIEQLQLSALMLEDSKNWGPAVRAIFQKIKLAHNISPEISISDLTEANYKMFRSLHDLTDQLQLSKETSCTLTDLLKQAHKTKNEMEHQIKDLVRQLSERTNDLKNSQNTLSQSNALVSALKLKVQDLVSSHKNLETQLAMAQKNNQKLQASLEVSNGLLDHARQDNQHLCCRLDTSLTQQATTQADFNRVSAEAQQLQRDQKDSDQRREEATTEGKIKDAKIAKLTDEISTKNAWIKDLESNLRDVKSPDGSIYVSGDALENLVLLNRNRGLTLSLGIPIAILTWVSFYDDSPKGNSRIGATVRYRVRSVSEQVRKYASPLSQHRWVLNEQAWEHFLTDIEDAVTTLMLPYNHETGKTANAGSHFYRVYSSLVRENR